MSDIQHDLEAENETLGEEVEQAAARYYAMREDRDRLQVLADVRARQLAGAVEALERVARWAREGVDPGKIAWEAERAARVARPPATGEQ
jgi:hypothetical protein